MMSNGWSNGWANGEWRSTAFVTVTPTPEQTAEHAGRASDMRTIKLGSEIVKHTAIPNEGGEYDTVTDTAGFKSTRDDLPA